MTDNDSVIVQAEAERQFCEAAFRAVSVPNDDAALIADTLVEADLRGVYSHGMQILPRYVRGLKSGINPSPSIKTVVDAGSLAVLDGDCGMGQVVFVKATELAIEKALQHGIAAVSVRNSNHLGALAYYGMMAVDRDMMGICTTNGPSIMAPWGGVTETLANNPICVAVPSGNTYPVLLDMAVSTVARNKIRVAAARGEKIPLDWALTREGQPTDDPQEALKGLTAPMSGAKGFGLSVAMEVLTGVLSNGLIGKDVPRDVIYSDDVFYPVRVSHYFQAIDVKRLLPPEEFKARVDYLAGQVHESELAKGAQGVFMPGEMEFITRERRLKEGIPIPSVILHSLDRISKEISVEPLSR